MKKYIIALCVSSTLTGLVHAELPASMDQLLAKVSPSAVQAYHSNAVVKEARENPEFYTSLKSAGFVFQGVVLNRAAVTRLAYGLNDYDAFDNKEAAKYLTVEQYKSYVATKVKALGSDAIVIYDWLQQQRLTIVEAAPRDLTEKGEFLSVISDLTLEQDKARSAAK